jgi:predicted TIM-barrel fold metal-dependent hydrolase
MTRRELFIGAGASVAALAAPGDPVIDIHQHVYYHERSDADLLAHHRGMGVTRTVLLPAGSQYGLAAECASNDTVASLARAHPGEFVFFANELPDAYNAREVLAKFLGRGAIGIGEQKFPVRIDSPEIELVASVAREFRVPVLLHFEHESYNTGFADFERVLKRHPDVNFIGHAQTWWSNISAGAPQEILYPKGRVSPGGLTDRLLSDYPNVWGDLSAGSGLNALTRDEDHARDFLARHQDRLLFGSDCADSAPGTGQCTGTQILKAVRRLAGAQAQSKLLYRNAAGLLRI